VRKLENSRIIREWIIAQHQFGRFQYLPAVENIQTGHRKYTFFKKFNNSIHFSFQNIFEKYKQSRSSLSVFFKLAISLLNCLRLASSHTCKHLVGI